MNFLSVYRTVIFDFDGIIVDTAPIHNETWRLVCEKYGLIFDSCCEELTKGFDRKQSFINILIYNNSINKFNSIKVDEICFEKNKLYQKIIEGIGCEVISPCFFELITLLKNHKIKIGLATSSKNAVVLLKKLNIDAIFDVIVTGQEIINAKPNPEVYISCLSKLKASPESCIVIEDALSGITAAHLAGVKAIYIGENYESRAVADHFFASLNKMYEFISNEKKGR